MIDLAGPFLLILTIGRGEGIAVQQVVSEQACRAVLIQIEPLAGVSGVCVAAQTVDDREGGEKE
jgi:hypothetical protein